MLNCGKREEDMKIKTYFVFVAAISFFCFLATARAELSEPGDESPLISQSHPAFSGINTLRVVLLLNGSQQDKDEQFYEQLEKDVEEKLRLAGIELETPSADNIPTIPELRIYIGMLSLEDSQRHVFHIRTALARAVCLKGKQNPVFKSDIWQARPVMQIISAENTPTRISNVVLEQVEGFIGIYKATSLTDKKLSEANINKTGLSTGPEKQIDAAEQKYVASKSSVIFHKPGCRWAQNISKENLITYNSKDEATKAGKRPCRTCKP